MHRKEFIRYCGGACLALTGLSFLPACNTSYHIQSTVTDNKITVPKTGFTYVKQDKLQYRRYVIVNAASLDHPIVVYRDSDLHYHALLLKCTHQGNELSVSGDVISCFAHGSEFSRTGKVLMGPAEQNLKTFRTTNNDDHVYIHIE